MTSAFESALREEAEVVITTYDAHMVRRRLSGDAVLLEVTPS